MTPTHRPAIATEGGLRLLGAAAPAPLDRASITAVQADGHDVWVLVANRDLYRVRDSSAELLASLDDSSAICLGIHHGEVWVGGEEAGLWRRHGSGLEPVASFQEAPTHEEWSTPWGGPPAIFSMASDGRELYVSVHVGGILRTEDGRSWVPTIDLHDDVHQVAVGDDGTVWAATGRRGLAASTDRGTTWRYHTSGLHASYALAVAAVTGGALVSVSSGPGARDGVVYRFDGQGFQRPDGLPEVLGGVVGPREMVGDGDHAVVALPNGDVYVSHDAGRSWEVAATGLPAAAEVALVPTTV